MSVNASQLDLNQLIYRHLKEHGFTSAAEELHRHSPQQETNPQVSLLDIYDLWLKKECPNSAKGSKSGKRKISSKAKSGKARKKTEKSVKNPTSSKKSVAAKRKKTEKSSQSDVKAKKSKLNATEKAVSEGIGSDSDSSLDVEKWKKMLDQLTEADIAKMETINSLTSPKPPPQKARVRKPRAKPVPKGDAPAQKTGETEGQTGTDEKTVVTQMPTKENMEKKKKSEENATHVTTQGTVTPNKTPLPPEKQARLEDMSLPVDKETDEEASEPKKKKKKKKEKERIESETDGNADETNGDKKEKKRKPKNSSEITELETEEAKRLTEEEKIEENSSKGENVSELVLQKKKQKKKDKEKSRSDENVDHTDEKTKKKEAGNDGNLEQQAGEMNPNTNEAGSDKVFEQDVQNKKAKKKKEKKKKEENVEYVTEERTVELNAEGNEHLEQTGKKKKEKTKTSNEENFTKIHGKKKKVNDNESDLDKVDEEIKVDTEQTLNTSKDEHNKASEQNVKKKKDRHHLEGNVEHVTWTEEGNNEQNAEDNRISEQTGEKKKEKKRKYSLGIRETPEGEVGKHKAEHKESDKEHSEQTVPNGKTKDEVGPIDSKSTSETAEQSLETTSPPKKKKKKNKIKSDEVLEEAEISTQDISILQTNSADVHKKKKKSKSKES